METTIEIPDDLRTRAEHAATARGLSLDDFVREALERVLVDPDETDPLFAEDAICCALWLPNSRR